MKLISTLLILILSLPATGQTFFGDVAPVVGNCESDNPVELGLKFTVLQSGRITALRFYKCTPSTQVYSMKLYAGSTQVASINHTSNRTGWIEEPIAPYAVTTGITYTVSYFAATGIYHSSVNNTYPIISGNLRASGSVYRYGPPTTTPPSQVFQTSNYYADVRYVIAGAPVPCDTVYKKDTVYLKTQWPDSSKLIYKGFGGTPGDSTVVYYYISVPLKRDTIYIRDTIEVKVYDTIKVYDTVTYYDTSHTIVTYSAKDTVGYPFEDYHDYKIIEFRTWNGKTVVSVRYRHYLMEAIKQEEYDPKTKKWVERRNGN